jgi:hypothetical protein
MRRSTIAGWTLAALIAVAAMQGMAQQDEGPILRPKTAPVKPAGPTLLVTCDLTCNWKLDGEAKGRIEADGSAKARVELGQHLVAAVTEDGLDKVQKEIEIKGAGQTILQIELKPVRAARLESRPKPPAESSQESSEPAKPAPQPAAQPEKPAPQPREEKQQERSAGAQEETGPTWTDPATGLMWAKKDSGSYATWQEATDYCRSLRLAGHSDWRLPAVEELEGIYDNSAGQPARQDEQETGTFKRLTGKVMSHAHRADKGSHVKGDLELSGCDGQGYCWAWSNSRGSAPGEMWDFYFHDGKRYSYHIDRRDGSALCVRRPGK